MIQVLLIDDEASARTDLHTKLAVHPDVAIVGEAATLRAARDLLAHADYDLVFLDVQLIGGESFQLLPAVHPGASVIFATAHECYAVRAFEGAAIDYLLKPVDPERLAEALRRAAVARAAHLALVRPTRPFTHLEPLAVTALSVFPENSSEVLLAGPERNLLRQSIEAWEDALPPTHVLRAQYAQTSHCRRTVRYTRGTEPTQLFLAAVPVSRLPHWWHALRARLGATRSVL
jgi:DNA-binding LytR/AlgR family response regulator